jgi:prevent-host-death family protein
MSKPINIHEAKTHLSRLVEQAAAGKEIVIAKAGKPMAKLVPIVAAVRPKKFGLLKGKFSVPEDFDSPLPKEILAQFHGE